MARKKILWLCSWYPNRADPFDGDFIQRHARAASLYNDIHVIRLVADASLRPGKTAFQKQESKGLTEQVVYLGKGKSLAGRFLFYQRWNRIFKDVIKAYLADQGVPFVVHVHVPYPAGRLALWLKQKYGVPFVVTEHWTIYQPGSEIAYSSQPARMRSLITRVMRETVLFLPVSRDLAEQVNRLVLPVSAKPIPNVVDTNHFCFQVTDHVKRTKFRYIHVSGMNAQKNPEGLLRAFAAAWQEDPELELWMLGNRDQRLAVFASGLDLPAGVILFGGEVSYRDVAKRMRECDALVLFSQVENAPCVISEALCCGLPVIATRTGGIPEMLNDSNGVLVEPGDETAMKTALLDLKKTYNRYNRAVIAAHASSIYNYEAVGKELSVLYNQVVLKG